MGSDSASVPAQGSEPKDAGGKKVSELVSADAFIDETGAVTGTLLYVDSMASFPEGENSGHYFPLTLGQKYSGKDITVKGKKTKTAQDLEWLLYVPDTTAKFTFETSEDGVFLTLTFTEATLAAKASVIAAPKAVRFSKSKADSYLQDI